MAQTPRTAVVTGSTSGIGKAIALRLLQTGYSVVISYSTNDQRAHQTLTECKSVSPDVVLVKADISSPAGAGAGEVIETCVREFGSLGVLVNNAARVADNTILDMTEPEWDTVLGVNLKGAFLCSQHAARQMLKQDDGGVILNIGASTGIRARRNGANTCASKAGLILLTQCLALELAPKVRANTIIPGLVETGETSHRFNLHDPKVRRAREDAIPMGRLGEPADIADAVMLMLARESGFMTGQKIVVDGGQNMW
jgi:NAD(P)-dependent dehydrogenase (short-subunit alcohol dehydrogenase family)